MSKKILTLFWLYNQFGGLNRNWHKFSHNGVVFLPPYERHNIPVIYLNQPITLSADAEEFATIYARYTDTEYIKGAKFRSNFWNDWKRILGKEHQIKSLDDCDFGMIYDHILKIKEGKKELDLQEKLQLKEQREKELAKYKIAYVDDKPQPVGNFMMEPPGIFIGRGCHPKMGKIKTRIYPEDITLNLSADAPIPELPEWLIKDNHKWEIGRAHV